MSSLVAYASSPHRCAVSGSCSSCSWGGRPQEAPHHPPASALGSRILGPQVAHWGPATSVIMNRRATEPSLAQISVRESKKQPAGLGTEPTHRDTPRHSFSDLAWRALTYVVLPARLSLRPRSGPSSSSMRCSASRGLSDFAVNDLYLRFRIQAELFSSQRFASQLLMLLTETSAPSLPAGKPPSLDVPTAARVNGGGPRAGPGGPPGPIQALFWGTSWLIQSEDSLGLLWSMETPPCLEGGLNHGIWAELERE